MTDIKTGQVYCGEIFHIGSDPAKCGGPWYGYQVYQCDKCRIKGLEAALEQANTETGKANSLIDDLRNERNFLQSLAAKRQADLEAALEAEQQLSGSYVRIRAMVGAMNPPSTEPDQLFAYVENMVSERVASTRVKLPRVAGVMWHLSDVAKHRTSAENVRDVLDAISASRGTVAEGE